MLLDICVSSVPDSCSYCSIMWANAGGIGPSKLSAKAVRVSPILLSSVRVPSNKVFDAVAASITAGVGAPSSLFIAEVRPENIELICCPAVCAGTSGKRSESPLKYGSVPPAKTEA